MGNFSEGQTISDRYTLLRKIGSGGFAEVWAVKDSFVGLEYALKVYLPGQGIDEDSIIVFRNEFKKTRGLKHKFLLIPSHFDIYNDCPYLLMDLCKNGSLTKEILKTGTLEENQLAKLIYQAASGLHYLHMEGMIHKDIKPDNILIDEQNNFLLSDFGISSRAKGTLVKATTTSSAMAVAYAPPERFSEIPKVLPKGDIFSLGVLLYETATGQIPWNGIGGMALLNGAKIPELPANFSLALMELVRQCMSLDPTKRPTAQYLAECADFYLQNGYWSTNNSNHKSKKTSLFQKDSRVTIIPGKSQKNKTELNPRIAEGITERITESQYHEKKWFDKIGWKTPAIILIILAASSLYIFIPDFFISTYNKKPSISKKNNDLNTEKSEISEPINPITNEVPKEEPEINTDAILPEKPSKIISLATPKLYPARTPGDNQFEINWSRIKGATAYTIHYATKSDFSDEIILEKTAKNTCIDEQNCFTSIEGEQLKTNTVYYVKVKAKNGDSKISNFSGIIKFQL